MHSFKNIFNLKNDDEEFVYNALNAEARKNTIHKLENIRKIIGIVTWIILIGSIIQSFFGTKNNVSFSVLILLLLFFIFDNKIKFYKFIEKYTNNSNN
ncbi:MAG: hypothetical protein PHX78_08270 [bacterium]|nr:hypothetical protein [bacterium]